MHTKMLDGFLGFLLTSWLEQVHPEAHVLTNQDTMTMNWEPHTTHNQRFPEPVMNMNYVNLVKKHWLASGLLNLQTMFQAHSGGVLPVPKMGEQEPCLSGSSKGDALRTILELPLTSKPIKP